MILFRFWIRAHVFANFSCKKVIKIIFIGVYIKTFSVHPTRPDIQPPRKLAIVNEFCGILKVEALKASNLVIV